MKRLWVGASANDAIVTPLRKQWFTAPGLTYCYVEAGSGPVVLLLHGFTGSKADWAPLIESLAPDYRIVAVDLPGHGESDAPADPSRYEMAMVARDLGALLAHLQVKRAHLLGYSMGGRLALYLALTQPTRWQSLALESASPGVATEAERSERRRQDMTLADFIEREGIEAFVKRWERLPLFASQVNLPEEVRQRHRERRLENRPLGLAGSLRGMGTGMQPAMWETLAELTLPSLLIVGELDEKFVALAREMLRSMPQALLTIVPQAGHTLHLEKPDVFAAVVQRWLASVENSD